MPFVARHLPGMLPFVLAACAASPEHAPLPSPPGSATSLPATTAETTASPVPSAVPGASSSAPSASAPAESASASAEPVPPDGAEIAYPFRGLATVPDDCKEPSVVLTTAPTKMGWDYDWTWTRQAFFANPQFQLVDWPQKPEKPMQVRLDMYEIPGGFALVGVCKDGATCNKLAAMYRGTVPTCNPMLHCGAVPMKGAPRRSKIIPADGQWLPLDAKNVVGRCARVGVCLSVKHEKTTHNPGVECQSSPAKARAECAVKPTCDEVVACLKK